MAPLCTSMEAVKDLSLHSESSQALYCRGKYTQKPVAGAMAPLGPVGEEVECNSYPEMPVSSPPCLAQVSKVDEGIQCSMSW